VAGGLDRRTMFTWERIGVHTLYIEEASPWEIG
jgi:hypothetical protein